MRYAKLSENNEVVKTDETDWDSLKRSIKQEHYKGCFVSTVFLPLDHSFGDGPPIHFETYVFPSNGKNVTSWGEIWGKRSASYDEALTAHQEAKTAIDNGEIKP